MVKRITEKFVYSAELRNNMIFVYDKLGGIGGRIKVVNKLKKGG